MRIKLLFIALFLTVTLQAEWYLENNPNFLTEENIGDQILTQGYIKIVHFMQPECHYCPEMKPHLEKLQKQLKDDPRINAKFYQLDCSKYGQLCSDFRITKMPYLIVFSKEGKVVQQLPGQRQAFGYTIQKVEQAISTMEFRQYQQKRLSLFKHIRSQGHGKQPIQLPQKTKISINEGQGNVRIPQNKDIKKSQQSEKIAKQQLQNNELKQEKKTETYQKQNNNFNPDQKNQQQKKQIIIDSTGPKNPKVNIQGLLPHQSRAKVVEEVLNTRQRRKMADTLKITSKIGVVILIIFFVALGLYLKSIVEKSRFGQILVRGKTNFNQQQYNPEKEHSENTKNSQ